MGLVFYFFSLISEGTEVICILNDCLCKHGQNFSPIAIKPLSRGDRCMSVLPRDGRNPHEKLCLLRCVLFPCILGFHSSGNMLNIFEGFCKTLSLCRRFRFRWLDGKEMFVFYSVTS